METWKPIVPPVSWPRASLGSFRQSRLQLRASLGPAQEVDADTNGVGLMDVWALHFSCGLEMILLAFKTKQDGSECAEEEPSSVELQASSTDIEVVAEHLPFPLVDLILYEPNEPPSPLGRWAVMRQDDNGHVFEVRRYASSCTARAALSTFEALHHKQTYWVAPVD